jgi:hypothetical protein
MNFLLINLFLGVGLFPLYVIVNHSCEPNSESAIFKMVKEHQSAVVQFMATQDINEGEEIRYNIFMFFVVVVCVLLLCLCVDICISGSIYVKIKIITNLELVT